MRKQTKKAFRELLNATKESLNNTEDSYINHFMPETGVYETEDKDVDENGNWGFRTSRVRVTEEDALYEAQSELLSKDNQSWFEDFLFEGDLRDKMLSFMRELCKEYVK